MTRWILAALSALAATSASAQYGRLAIDVRQTH